MAIVHRLGDSFIMAMSMTNDPVVQRCSVSIQSDIDSSAVRDRNHLLSLLGKMPRKVELDLSVVEEVDCGAFVRKKVQYSSEAGEVIPAFLCIPKNIGTLTPAIYCFHQHANNWLLGKSEVVGLIGSPDQAYAKELVERGYVTLAPDAIGFEERTDVTDPVAYHAHQLHNRLMNGQTLLGKVLFDVSAGIDLLQSLPVTIPQTVF